MSNDIPIYIFMHIYTINHWKEIVEEQEKYINESGLFNKAKDVIKIIVSSSKNDYEFQTMRKIYEHCLSHKCYVLYIHTKAVTWPEEFKELGTDTRKGFQDAVITNWEYCVENLQEYDAVGVNWRDGSRRGGWEGWSDLNGVFLGTFWWAKSEYIKTLPIDEPITSRFYTEKWIGKSSNFNAKYLGIETKNQYHLRELLGDKEWERRERKM